jgi:16S rRNA (guanine527-N7)-methyltransferase
MSSERPRVLTATDEAAVRAGLEVARSAGFLGPGPLDQHVEHALGFADVIAQWLPRSEDRPDERPVGVDMGTGGGLPGLVLAVAVPEVRWVLLDSMVRRTSVLERVATGPPFRCRVVTARAEAWAAQEGRGIATVVVARSFGPPPLVAECAAPMLSLGGVLVVSDPPSSSGRWDRVALAGLGLTVVSSSSARGSTYTVLRRSGAIEAGLPRRPAAMAKRPLF